MGFQANSLVQQLLEIALDKKAENPAVYRVSPVVDYADTLIVLTIHNPNHAKAVTEAMAQGAKPAFGPPLSIEGQDTNWAILDFGDVIVHLFEKETREYYDLDGLWMDMRSEQTSAFPVSSRGFLG
jgi:ribosome-associated protein